MLDQKDRMKVFALRTWHAHRPPECSDNCLSPAYPGKIPAYHRQEMHAISKMVVSKIVVPSHASLVAEKGNIDVC